MPESWAITTWSIVYRSIMRRASRRGPAVSSLYLGTGAPGISHERVRGSLAPDAALFAVQLPRITSPPDAHHRHLESHHFTHCKAFPSTETPTLASTRSRRTLAYWVLLLRRHGQSLLARTQPRLWLHAAVLRQTRPHWRHWKTHPCRYTRITPLPTARDNGGERNDRITVRARTVEVLRACPVLCR